MAQFIVRVQGSSQQPGPGRQWEGSRAVPAGGNNQGVGAQPVASPERQGVSVLQARQGSCGEGCAASERPLFEALKIARPGGIRGGSRSHTLNDNVLPVKRLFWPEG